VFHVKAASGRLLPLQINLRLTVFSGSGHQKGKQQYVQKNQAIKAFSLIM
jgi:hypothetical protein